MNYKIVTAFDETSLQHSTFHLLNEFKDNWEPSIEFHCYYYNLDLANYSLPKAKNIFYHNLMEISDYPDFFKTFAQHDGTEGGKIPYNDILNPLKYIPKVIALTECAFDSTNGWLFWFDPSCMNIKNIYQKDIDTIFPEHSDKLDLVTFTEMEQLIGFNLDRETPVRLLGDLRGAFISGEFLNYREWHDSFIFDRLKLIYNARLLYTSPSPRD